MTQAKPLEARIDELEIQIAHQDVIIEDLHKALADQWQEIRELKRQLGNLGSRIQSIEENGDAPSEAEPPPPHY